MVKIKVDTKSIKTIEKSFLEIAEELMVKHVLKVGVEKYRISNLEFYYYNEDCHRDKNCHACKYQRAKERQLLNSEWYVHKKSINLNYNYKGIDFTFGDGKNYGGILIKEVEKIDCEKVERFSQSKFVDELIRVLAPADAVSFLELIEEKGAIQFVKSKPPVECKIKSGKRKGLATQDDYANSLYAFYSDRINESMVNELGGQSLGVRAWGSQSLGVKSCIAHFLMLFAASIRKKD